MRERATFIHHSVEWVIPTELITFRTLHQPDRRAGNKTFYHEWEERPSFTLDGYMTCTVGRVTAFRRLRAEDLAA